MTLNQLAHGIRDLLSKGTYEWEALKPARHLPPGAWLKRVGETGSILDFIQPHFVHPLEALAVTKGCYPMTPDGGYQAGYPCAGEFVSLNEARGSFKRACEIWGAALDVGSDRAALLFHYFTPWNTGPSSGNDGHPNRRTLYGLLGLGAEAADAALATARAIDTPPVYRPDFWEYTL